MLVVEEAVEPLHEPGKGAKTGGDATREARPLSRRRCERGTRRGCKK
jgi:hypothetical protein